MSNLIVARGRSNTTNLIDNGRFTDGTGGWYQFDAGTVAFEDEESNQDDGSGSISLFKSGSALTVHYRPGGVNAIPLQSLTSLDFLVAFKGDGVGAAQAHLRFFDDAIGVNQLGNVSLYSDTTASTDWQVRTAYGIAVPDGSTHCRLELTKGSDVDTVFFDDVYLGATVFPQSAEPPLAGDRISNGSFETGVLGWEGWWSTETIAPETVAPITGSGSLSVTTPGGGEEQGVFYPSGNANFVLVVPDESLTLSFRIRGSGTIKAVLDYEGASDATVWTGTLSSTPTVVSQAVTVPAGAFKANVEFLTTTDQAVTFYVDDVSLTAAAP